MKPLRYPIRNAIAWRIMTELLRRHHGRHKLRLLILHPSGGLSRQLALYTAAETGPQPTDFWRRLCEISLIDSTIHGLASAQGAQHQAGTLDLDFPVNTLFQDPKEVVDRVEGAVRLQATHSAGLPPTTPAVLGCRLIAALERNALSRDEIDVDCGWVDTAGYFSGVHLGLQHFPTIWPTLPNESTAWEARAKAASRYWIVGRKSQAEGNQTRLVVDLRGQVYFSSRPEESWDIWTEYARNGRRLLPLIHRAELALA